MAKIEYITGRLEDTDCTIIAHGCNAQGVMGSGVARALRDKWPQVYTDYREEYKNYGLALGDVITTEVDFKYICSVITQEFYGRDNKQYVDYNAILKCFDNLTNHPWEDWHVNLVVAIPKIGCGLGGGDWNVVETILKENFNDFTFIIHEI